MRTFVGLRMTKVEIVLNAPVWFVLLCLLCGFVYSFFLYALKPNTDWSLKFRLLLGGLRFITVSLIAFLLLSPLLKTKQRSIEKPLVVFVHDNSESVVLNSDSSFYSNEFAGKWKELINSASEKYEVESFVFDREFRQGDNPDFSGNLTDMSLAINEIATRYYRRNLGAVVLAGDGLYNAGQNPQHLTSKIDAPFYTVALGDTTFQRDLLIRHLVYNKIAFAGNRFQLEIQLAATRCKGESAVLSVSGEGKTLHTQTIRPLDDVYTETVTLSLEAGTPGIKRYRVAISELPGEVSRQNNYRDIYFEVMESRLKVAIISHSPHPDIAALRFALESNQNYEVESFVFDKYNKPYSAYNLFILHQLPSVNRASETLVAGIRQAGVPILYVVGPQTNLAGLNAQRPGVGIVVSRQGFNESLPVMSGAFSLFTISESTRRALESWPPLSTWFADYRLSNAANVMLQQKIGRVQTNAPLFLFSEDAGYRTGIIAGVGVWKWRMHDFSQNQNHLAFNELITKSVQYLSLKASRDFFRVYGDYLFDENSPVQFFAELYNDNYEPVNDPEVRFVIQNEEGKRFTYAFSRREKDYALDAGIFPPGDYRWEASASLGGRSNTARGRFSVEAIQTERLQTRADHGLMYRLAESTGGKMFYPNQLEELLKALDEREDIRPLIINRKKLSDLINFPWLLGLLILLLATEWLLRKRYGTY